MSKILLTGGLGYIGSHVAVELAENGHEVVVLDDLSNSELFVHNHVEELTESRIPLEQGDVRDDEFLSKVFERHSISAIIHFAAKKSVGESVEQPLLYYDVNVNGLITLLKVAEQFSVKKLIFSSSCTVYGSPENLPVTENSPFGITPSPYGKSKQMCEHILESVSRASDLQVVSLRYFNPVGAHPTGLIGELPKGVPNNLMPFITQTAIGLRDQLKVFGGDYDTPDGSCIRDYIHVVDLAKAHEKALEVNQDKYLALNIGTGKGHSVLEVVGSFEKITNQKLNYKVVDRREGDVPIIYGDPSKAEKILNWRAQFNLEDMLRDSWNWQTKLSR